MTTHSAIHRLLATLSILAAILVASGRPAQPAAAATNITVSGTIWDTDPLEYACASNGNLTVRVRVNGGGSYSGTCTANTGAYSIPNVSVDPSDVLTVFVDNASVHASFVTRVAGTPANMTLDLYQGFVYLGHADSGPITNANLDLFDSGQNSNLDFTVTSNNLTVNNAAGLWVSPNTTYLPGGTVSGSGLYVYADTGSIVTFDTNGNSLTGVQGLGGTFRINSNTTVSDGSLNASSGTITTTAGTPTVTLAGSSGSLVGSMTFHNLTFSGSGSRHMSFDGNTVTVNNNVTIENGVTLNQYSHLSVTGTLTTVGTGAFTAVGSAPTTTVGGSAIGGGSGDITFHALTKSVSGTTTWSGTGRMTVKSTLTVSAGTLSVTAGQLFLAGTINTSGGVLSATGNVVYAQTGGATVSTSGSYGGLTLSDGLVGYWKLDETAGPTSADSSGFGHSGTHTASPTVSSDIPTLQFTNSRSIDLNGSSQYIDLGDPMFLDDQLGNKLTVSAWVKPDVSKSAVIIAKSNNAAHSSPFYNYALFQSGNILSWRVGSVNINSSGSGTGALVVNGTTWQHVVGTYDGTTMRSYINGIEVASGAQTGNVPTSDRNARIGARHTTSMDEFFDGKIDDGRIYRRALSAQEVRALAAGNHPGGSSATFTLGGNLDVNGDLTIGSGLLDVDNSQNYSINVTGNFYNFGALQPRNGLVTLDGTASGKIIETGQQRFNNLTVAGANGVWTLNDRLWVNGTLAVSNGTLDVSSNNYRIHAGTLNQTGGTITAQSGTVILDATSAQTVNVTSTLNNLRIEDPSISNLGGYWKLDELSGTAAKDSSGNSVTGTLTNAPAYTTSLNSTTTFDNAAGYDFDGTDDYVTMGDVLDANDTADLTISGWFNRDTFTTDDVIVAKRNGNASGDVGYIVWIDQTNDLLRFEASDGTDEYELASTTAFTGTGWNHFVVIWDQDSAANSKIFINGSDNNATATGTIGAVDDLSNALALRIGAESDAGSPFDGKIDDIRIHTAALTTAQAANLGAGKYADGTVGTATFTLGATTNIGGTLSIDSGTLATGSQTITVTNAFTLASGHGAYSGGSTTQTFNGGLTVSGSTLTGGAGTIDVNGAVVLSGGSVTTGSGNWAVNGSYTHSGSTMTYTAGNTLTMDGTGTLTSNGQTLQNLSIISSGTVTLAAAAHTVAGNLVLSGSGTPTVTGSTITMTGTSNTIDGGGKTLATLTIDPSSGGTITLRNTDLTVNTLLTVAASDTLSLDASRTLTLSGNSGTTLTLSGTISGNGRLTYQNSATTFPIGGAISSILRFDLVNNSMTMPNRAFGAVEVYNGTSSSQSLTPAAGTPSMGNLTLYADGSGNTTFAGATNNPTVTVNGNISYGGTGGGSEVITSGTSGWTVSGDINFTNGTFTAASGNTVTMTGTSSSLNPNSQSFVNLTIDPSTAGTVTLTGADTTVTSLLTVASGDTLSILDSSRILTLSGNSGTTLTLNGTISGAGRLIYQNSATTFPTGGTISSVLRFDHVNNHMTIPARAYGSVEIFNGTGTLRTATLGAGSLTASNFYVSASSTANMAVTGVTNAPSVSISGNLDFTGAGSGTETIVTGAGAWSITGDADFRNGTFTASTNNVLTMNGAAGTMYPNNASLYDLVINPSTTGTTTVATSSIVTVLNALTVAASDTLDLLSNSNVSVWGAITLNGTISGPGMLSVLGTLGTTGTISSDIFFNGASCSQVIPTRSFLGSTRTVHFYNDSCTSTIGSSAGTISIAGNLIIDDGGGGTGFTAATSNPDISVDGNMSGNGYGEAQLIMGSGTWTVAGNIDLTGIVSLTPGASTVVMTGTSKNLTSAALSLNHLTVSGTVTGIGAVSLNGNFTIQSSAGFTAPSAFTVRGNFDNNGTFTHSNGTVTLAATTTGKTIECGSSQFYNLTVNGASGGWTMQTNDCTVANALALTSATSFTLQSGRTLTVNGSFTNAVGGAATTWTGATLSLAITGASAMNTKTSGGDIYDTLLIGASAQLSAWNSDVVTLIITPGGALVSQDHAAIDGRLHIFGTANSRSNEYWSYATDFDGTALNGASRATDVRLASGATFTVDAGDTLAIIGQSPTTNRTSLSHQTSGSYSLTVNGTINAKYFDFDNLATTGLTLGSTATVADLSYGSFDHSAGGANATYITVNGTTSTASLTNLVFDSAGDGADSAVTSNIRATGSGINWTMVSAAGLKRGPTYEFESSGATLNWNSPTITVADGLVADVDLVNQTEELSANWTLSSTVGVDHLTYAIGTTVGGSDVVPFTSVGAALSVTNSSLSLTSGTTYYVTVRATDPNSETVTEASSDGVLVDAAAPELTDLTLTATSSTMTVTWVTSEAATTLVRYDTSNSLSLSTTLDSNLVTNHSVTLSGLSANTTYYVRAESTDQAGNTGTSATAAISTSSPAAPVVGPRLGRPIFANGVNPTLTITGLAHGQQTVRLFLDGKRITSIPLKGGRLEVVSFSYRLNLKKIKNGRHRITATTVSASGVSSEPTKAQIFTISRVNGRLRLSSNTSLTYRVVRGDSLWRLAQTFFGNGSQYAQIITSNVKKFPSISRAPFRLLPDWLLIIPKK